MKDKKSIIFITIGIVFLIAVIICFIIVLRKPKPKTSNNTTSKDYDNVDYGKTSKLDTTSITKGGSYELTGEYSCINVNTSEDVELKLNNVTISCDNGPAINIEEAKTVSIVLMGENTIEATTTTDLDGAIYSKADLVFSGEGSLKVKSNLDGIVSKDTLVFKSGTYEITTEDDGIRGKDSITIIDGTFTINTVGDAIKATNEEDSSKGYIEITGGTFKIKTTGNTANVSAKGIKAVTNINIKGGTFDIDTTDDSIHSNGDVTIDKGKFNITSKDDGIHADGKLETNGGTYDIIASEGMEATYVKINDGTINIDASDDGINAGNKSDAYSVKVEINGGTITVKMGQGDTDGVDSNGDIIINGGKISVTGQSTFDYDGNGTINGGTVICNGEEVSELPNQIMGGPGGMQGGRGPGMR